MALHVVSSPAVEHVLSKLEGVKGGAGDKWTALCPAHPDRTQSLSIALKGEKIVMKCHAGCETLAIVMAIGLTLGDLFLDHEHRTNGSAPVVTQAQGVSERSRLTKSYDYVDEDGELLYQVCRFEPKTFRQRRPGPNGEWQWGLGDMKPVLYRLNEIIEAVATEHRIYLVEGEKDADTLCELGLFATTAPMGAGKWRESYSTVLAGGDVVILPDNDDVGRAHAEQVAASLVARGCTVRVINLPNLPPKGDVTDWLTNASAPNTLADLDALVRDGPLWSADPLGARVKTRWRLDELWQNEAIMRPPPPIVPYLAWASRTTLLAAREKSGKSTLTGYMAARVSVGGDFLGEPCHRGRVLILGLEEYIGDTARRLKEFRADGRMIELVDHFAGSAADRPDEVRAHLEAVDPILVIIDSLIAYASGVVTDANNATQTQAIVQSIANLSHETTAAFVIIHHARKADGKYRDSSAIGGAVDVIAEVFPPEETEKTDPNRRRVRPIGRVPARSVDFRFTGSEYELVDPNGPVKGPLDQRISEVIRERPGITASDVADAVGERRAEVLNRITILISKQLIINDGDSRRTRLRLPSFAPAAAFL